MRLNRYLAACGLGSRRSCEDLIRAGKVCVNGHFIVSLATQVEEGDEVFVGGRIAHLPQTKTVIALHKPKGFVTTRSDEKDRRTVYDLLPPRYGRFIYVGRLDKDSEGLLLLTDDGMLARKLSHPNHKVEKEYDVWLDRPIEQEDMARLMHGFSIVGGRAKMQKVQSTGLKRIRVILTQGIKRQIRLMLYHLGYEVERLLRVRVGPILLDKQPAGHYCILKKDEVRKLAGE